jgi:hypothetical protein
MKVSNSFLSLLKVTTWFPMWAVVGFDHGLFGEMPESNHKHDVIRFQSDCFQNASQSPRLSKHNFMSATGR